MIEKSLVYIDIEAILDPVLATMAHLNHKVAAELAVSDKYHERLNDDIWLITDKVTEASFKKAWAERKTNGSLQYAKITKLSTLLQRRFYDAVKDSIAPVRNVTGIRIDFCGYELTNEVKQEMLHSLETMYVADTVEEVNHGAEGLTPELIGNNYQVVVIRDLTTWLAKHHVALASKPLPSVIFESMLMLPAEQHSNVNWVKFFRSGEAHKETTKELCGVMSLFPHKPDVFSIVDLRGLNE